MSDSPATPPAPDPERPDLLPPLPVTVVGGFLGSGKTTLINDLIGRLVDRRIAVVVNDFGQIDIDGALIKSVHDDVVTLTNGCICCSIRGNVAKTVLRLGERADRPEHVVVEASGVSEPGALADLFIDIENVNFVRVDGLVTVVDADGFDLDDPRQGRLARAQVAQADLLVLSKLDLVSPERTAALRTALRAVNPAARIVDKAEVAASVVLGLRDDLEPSAVAREAPDAETLFKTAYWRHEAPVSREILPYLVKLPAAIYRAKGWLTVAVRPEDKILLHVVGKRLKVRTVGRWADQPEETPRTEIVFIGRKEGWDPAKLRADLSALAGRPGLGGRVPDAIDADRE